VLVLRDYRQVARLWLCEDFIPAFHFVFGWPHKARPRYKAIRKTDALLPAAEVGRLGLYVLDVLAGDDQYNFLAPVKRPLGIADPICYGFVFDAEQLIEQGALVGTEDLLITYRKIVWSITGKHGFDGDHVGVLGHQKFTPEAMQEFLSYTSGRSWGEDWSQRKRLDVHLGEMLDAFREAQQRTRKSGMEALEALRDWAASICADVHYVLEKAAEYGQTPEFHESFLRHLEHFPHWGPGKICGNTLRDSVAGDTRYLNLTVTPTYGKLTSSPEILWRGRLPLGLARAAIELPCVVRSDGLYGGLSWPDDLFGLLCRERRAY